MEIMEWNNDTTLHFLELYRDEPCLWDPSHHHHKRKEKIAAAWKRISESTGKSVFELKKKKDSLMATFRGHSRRIRASIKSGAERDDIHKPVWFAFSFMESFLGQLYECQPTINTEDTIIFGNENLDSQQSEGNDSMQTPQRRRNSPELRETENEMKEPFILLKNVVSQNEEDECDLYGKILAKKLRKLPEFERECLMHDIDGMVLNALHRSRFCAPIPSTYSSRQLSTPSSVASSSLFRLSENRNSPSTPPYTFSENTSQDPAKQPETQDVEAVGEALLMKSEHID